VKACSRETHSPSRASKTYGHNAFQIIHIHPTVINSGRAHTTQHRTHCGLWLRLQSWLMLQPPPSPKWAKNVSSWTLNLAQSNQSVPKRLILVGWKSATLSSLFRCCVHLIARRCIDAELRALFSYRFALLPLDGARLRKEQRYYITVTVASVLLMNQTASRCQITVHVMVIDVFHSKYTFRVKIATLSLSRNTWRIFRPPV